MEAKSRRRWRHAHRWPKRRIGSAGDDDHAYMDFVRRWKLGAWTHTLIRRSARHRRAIVLVNEQTGDRTVLWERDAACSTPTSCRAQSSKARSFMSMMSTSTRRSWRGIARRAGIPVTSDIDHVNERTCSLIEAVTVPIFAEHVPRA